ncbi:MAG: hypothetical protein AAF985_27770 [Bacteroidota bacterium]
MKLIKIVVFLLALPLGLAAQEGTSLEEYRYLSKGYAYQQEMGLDANKAGYTIQEAYVASNKVRIVGLYKQYQSAPQGLLFIMESQSGQAHHLCLPNNQANDRVKELFASDYRSIPQQAVKQAYELALREYLFATLEESPIAQTTPPAYGQVSQLEVKSPVETPSVRPSKTPDILSAKGLPSESYSKSNQTVSRNSISQSQSATTRQANISIGGYLSERSLRVAPQIKDGYSGRGKIVIKICVNQSGEVTQAKFTQRGSTTFNRELKSLAIDSAKESLFARSELAEQCGTIAYHFK